MQIWERRGIGLLVAAIAVAFYAPTLAFGRVQLDDYWLWADDSPLRHLDAHTLHQIVFELEAKARHPFGTEYLPVRDLVVALDMRLWGQSEHGPHATQLLLFALTVFGLGTLFIRYGVERRIAWTATLLWAIHPMHLESVAWLSERKGVLSGLLVIACGHAWCRYRSGRAWWWLPVATAAAVAAVWSKAPAMFGVLALGSLDLALLPAGPRRWRAIGVVGLATLLAAVPVVIVAMGAHVIGEAPDAGPGRLVSALGAQGHYLETLVLARQPAIAYPIQTDGPGALALLLGALAMAGSIALVLWSHRRGGRRAREVYALLAWAWIWFLPISHLVMPVHIFVADRFAYMWLAAPCLAVAALSDRLPTVARTAVVAALIGALGIATVRAEGAWVSSVDLFSRAVASNPRDRIAYENLAIALERELRPDEALAALDRGLAVLIDEPHLLSRKAMLLFDLRRVDESLAVSRRAADSGAASAMWNHAVLLQRAGRAAEALPWAERAVRKHPEIASYLRTKVAIMVELGRLDDAIALQRDVVALEPDSVSDRQMLEALVNRVKRGGSVE